MVPHGRNFNTFAAAGAFDHGQNARIDAGHVDYLKQIKYDDCQNGYIMYVETWRVTSARG